MPNMMDLLFGGAGGFDEAGFQGWYGGIADKWGLDPNPDDYRHYYDWRAAYEAGVRAPTEGDHWPSAFKRPGHPNRYVGGVDTITGEPVAGGNPVLEDISRASAEMAERDMLREEAMRNLLRDSQQPYIRGKTTNIVPMDHSR